MDAIDQLNRDQLVYLALPTDEKVAFLKRQQERIGQMTPDERLRHLEAIRQCVLELARQVEHQTTS